MHPLLKRGIELVGVPAVTLVDHPINEWLCVKQCSAEHVGTLGHVLVERALEWKRFVWPQIVDCSAPEHHGGSGGPMPTMDVCRDIVRSIRVISDY